MTPDLSSLFAFVDQDAVMREAAAIHEQGRTVFDFGPAPFGHELVFTRDGKEWRVRIGATMPPKQTVDALGALFAAVKDAPPETLLFGLAYIQAATNASARVVATGGAS